ncbi:response regulator [Sporosarcina sp. ITBMC105]
MIKAIIVDDEQLALRHLEKKLQHTGIVEVVATFSNATEVLKGMKHLQFDVAFLDIEMPGLSGLDLADLMNDWNKDIFIVFVTAYRDYAVQAFELHSIDYLLKPILLERLEKTTARIEEQIRIRSTEENITVEVQKPLKILCFKEFMVFHHDTPVKWKTAKVKELFAFLFTHLDELIPRDTLIDALWFNVDYQRAKIQLHTTMSYLRKLLGDMGYPDAITFSSGGYTMRISRFECDVHQFETMIESHSVVTDNNFEMFESIVQHYSGDYMDTTGYEWALPKAHAIRQKLLHVLQQMVDYFTNKGMETKIQQYLQLLVSHNPYSEHTIQQLMKFYVKIGNRGEAVRVYNEMKNMLIEDLGILPDQSTKALYESIINN